MLGTQHESTLSCQLPHLQPPHHLLANAASTVCADGLALDVPRTLRNQRHIPLAAAGTEGWQTVLR
jgi:hypothetical protein